MPPHITAGTGMDALAHCLEAYCAPGYHPMADGIAVEGMRLVKEYLPRAYKDGNGHRGARAHDVGRRHGRHGVPERAWAPSMRCRIRSARSTTPITA